MASRAIGSGKRLIFLLNLLQDVNILRGVIFLAARETDAEIIFLVSRGFLKRDRQQIWQSQVGLLASQVGAKMYVYGQPSEAVAALAGRSGIVFAASESDLPAHHETSDVFRLAPPEYLKVTLQHGFECVGFRQSREHVMSHGRNVSFAADVICGWSDAATLTSLVASERSKLYVTGPPTLLQVRGRPGNGAAGGGLVCENMHSVRLRASGDHKASFMDTFFAFCEELGSRGEAVTLRPHPGGQYVLKHNVALPANVQLDNRPIFDVDLSSYKYGISAPSTIVFDMVLAGIPVGLWRDPAGVMDASNYDGLTEISTLEDWLAFERDVQLRPEMILDRQAAFLQRLVMPLEPSDVYRRFARLMVAGLEGIEPKSGETSSWTAADKPRPLVLAEDALVEVHV